MFVYPRFEVEVARTIAANELRWPNPSEAEEDSGLGCNRLYADLRFLSWADAKRTFTFEGALISRVENADDLEAELDAIDEESFEGDGQDLFGLDLGVGAAVVSLSACGCIPFSSCNGGSFGGGHNESYPLVAFYARAKALPLIIEAASESGVGLRSQDGAVIAYAPDLRDIRALAAALIRRRDAFDALKATRKRPPGRKSSPEQLELALEQPKASLPSDDH